MVDSIPLLIQLSPLQRRILNLIVQDQASVQAPVEPGRVILLWSEGDSETATAQKLGISVEAVRILRYYWWASATRIAAAERKSEKAFYDLVSLIFQFSKDAAPTETVPSKAGGSLQTSSASHEKPAKHKELRSATRALIEILHHKPKVYGINRSNWTQKSLAMAFEKLYGQRPSEATVGRLLKEAGLSWKKSRKFLTSPDPNYREKVSYC